MSQKVSVFKLSHPKYNVKLSLNGEVKEVALAQFSFTPKIADDDECISKKLTFRAWNQQRWLGIRSGIKAWTCHSHPVPHYVAIEDATQHNMLVVEWPDDQYVATGQAPFGYPVVGRLGAMVSGVHMVEPAMNEAGGYTAPVPEPPVVEKQAKLRDEELNPYFAYKGDSFIIMKDGHYIDVKEYHKPEGEQFIVPKDFVEFYEQHPKHITNWVKKRLGKYVVDEDVEDMSQSLIQHLCSLSPDSKYRKEGKTDLIQTFCPYRKYGANAARFLSYINNCMANKSMTGQKKDKNSPICRKDTVSLTSEEMSEDTEYCGEMTGEYAHTHSEVLSQRTINTQRNHENRFFTQQFKDFVRRNEPDYCPVIDALMETRTQKEAIAALAEATGITVSTGQFNKYKTRLQELASWFLGGTTIARTTKRKSIIRNGGIMASAVSVLEDFVTLELTVYGARIVPNPSNKERYSVYSIAPFEMAPKLRTDVCPWGNPRIGNPLDVEAKKSPMVKILAESAMSNPLAFLDNNGGVVLVCDSVDVQDDGGKLILKMDKKRMRGLVDGGTTAMTLADVVTDNPNLLGFFKLEIRCGDFSSEAVATMAQALNKREKVDGYSLATHRGVCDNLKRILSEGKEGFPSVPKIQYFAGDTGKLEIADVLNCLCAIIFKNPVNAYNSNVKLLSFLGTPEGQGEVLRYGDMLVDLLYYSEVIQMKIDQLQGERLRTLPAMKGSYKTKKQMTLPMTKYSTNFRMDNAVLIPLMASLKGAIDQESMTWIVNPEVIIEKIGVELMDTILDTYKGGWNAVGKDGNMYKLLTMQVQNFVMREGTR